MKTYAVIDESNKVLFVHDWSGQIYDAETSPTGWTPPKNSTSIDISDYSDKQLVEVEAGGTYDPATQKFTRDPTPPEPVVQDPTQLVNAQELVSILIDKGIITQEDVQNIVS